MKTDTDNKNVLSGAHAKGMRATAIVDLINVTWRMTVPTVLGVALGMGADKIFGSSPIGFLVGAVAGFGLGVFLAVRLLKKVSEDQQ